MTIVFGEAADAVNAVSCSDFDWGVGKIVILVSRVTGLFVALTAVIIAMVIMMLKARFGYH